MKLKKILCLILIFIMLVPMTVSANTETVEVTAPIAVLMDGKTRKGAI